jgi:hypothetical protein
MRKTITPSKLPATATEEQKTRLTKDLHQRLNAVVDKVAADYGMTRDEALRRAIEFLRNPRVD